MIAAAPSALGDQRERELEAVGKTEALLDSALAERESSARERVRALYKASRAGDTPLWVDADARRRKVRWRGLARRITLRELRELALFREERRVAARARARIEGATAAPAPVAGSLARPVPGRVVAGPGIYRHRASRAELVRRGALLRASAGEAVVAPADGAVVFAGPLRGLDHAVVMDHGDFYTVVGHLAAADVSAGERVVRGHTLGRASGRRVYLEVRRRGQAGGEPIDPVPLLGR